MWTNYHSHSHFCDGQLPPAAHAAEALRQGFAAFGFSSHGPAPFASEWNMPDARIPGYLAEIRSLKEVYAGQIELYLGMEVDYIPGRLGPRSPEILGFELDYNVGSVHYVDAFEDGTGWEIDGSYEKFRKGLEEIFQSDVRAVVERYFEYTRQMLRESPPDVLGHLDKIKMQAEAGGLFSEEEAWYRAAVGHSLEEIRGSGCIVEVNTRGVYKGKSSSVYPSPWILKQLIEMQVPLMLNSDSHHPSEISAGFEAAATLLQTLGCRQLWALRQGEWQAFAFDKQGLLF